MTIALFKSILHTSEGETVWTNLKQKVVDIAEAPAHIAEGWYKDAAEALDAHELAKLEADNARMEAQIAAEQTKLDGRTSAAKALRAKNVPNVPAETASLPEQNSTPTASESQTSATPPVDIPSDTPAT